MKRNIALYGGSFDPPHLGHVEVVKVALNILDIEKVIVVPAYKNPFKSNGIATAKQRLNWLKKIFLNIKRVTISDFEILQNRSVSSIETVTHFKKNYDNIFFIIGADNLQTLTQWNNFNLLNQLVTWVIATRDNIELPSTNLDILSKYKIIEVNVDISSTQLRQKCNIDLLPKSVSAEIDNYYSNI